MNFVSETLFYVIVLSSLVFIIVYFIECVESIITLCSQYIRNRRKNKDKNSR